MGNLFIMLLVFIGLFWAISAINNAAGRSLGNCDQESKMQQKWESECSIIGNSNTSKLGTIMQR